MMEQFGKIDFSILCFDTPCGGAAITATGIGDWEKMIDQNISAYFIAARIVFNCMRNNKQAMFISICYQTGSFHSTQCDLAELSSVMQKEMAVMFSKRFQKKQVRFHHIFFSDIYKMKSIHHNSSLLTKSKMAESNLLGEYIIRLYKGEVENAGALFHSLSTNDTIENKHP